MTERVVVLDRDGVINEDSDAYVKSIEEWTPIAGSIEAMARLSACGFRLVVVSNQSGIGRGYFELGSLAKMHAKLRDLLARQGGRVEMIAFCPHRPEERCGCRKPRTGLLESVEMRLGLSLQGRPLIGDSLGDVEAARAWGMDPWLVQTGKGWQTSHESAGFLGGVRVFRDLRHAAEELLKTGGGA